MNLTVTGHSFVWFRRASQVIFFVLFVWLLLATRAGEDAAPGLAEQGYFSFDPLTSALALLAAHRVPAILALGLLTLVLTVLMGRVFCGWICPLGTLNAWFAAFRKPPRRILVQTEDFSPWQRWKYYLLATLMGLALVGANYAGWFDPFSLLYRGFITGVLPFVQHSVEDASTALYQADPKLGPLRVIAVSEPVYRFFRDTVFQVESQVFSGSGLILLLLIAIVALNLFRKRFWCRYLCPLGALLGVFSQRPLLRVESRSASDCTNCGLCHVDCQGAANPSRPGEQLPSECFLCGNCMLRCPQDAIGVKLVSPLQKSTGGKLNLSKRGFLTTGAAGLAGLAISRVTPVAQGRTYNPALIRPPGVAAEREFLKLCIECGLCLKVCPTNALHPATSEAGFEGLWTPVLIPRLGYCEYECTLCGQVCPTGAIANLPMAEKQKVKIGLATLDTTRCLPYAYERNCIVCEEHCPVPNKAIYFVETPVLKRDGTTVVLKQPRVDPNLCIGCGICEKVCVFKDYAAIRVTSANETRHPDNQPILPGWENTDQGFEDQNVTPIEENLDPYGTGLPY